MILNVLDMNRPFVMIEKDGRASCYQGKLHQLGKLEDIHALARRSRHDVAFVLPYRIIRERGFEAQGDEPILAMEIEKSLCLPKEQLIAELPADEITLAGDIEPSMSDADYAALVKRFQENEIERGNASQTTLARRFSGRIEAFDLRAALSIYRRVVAQQGQYMAVLFANIDAAHPENSQFIVGATPERHLEIRGNETIMIPIAGTLRKEDRATFEARLDAFLDDPKEINELFQVVDEELKIMGVICPDGGEVEGPFLREIGAVVHSEYRLVGRRGTDSIAALRRTLHAPTVVGSPMESAARIIRKYEPESRRYYAGEIGVYSCPRTDAPNGDLDCAILIRCAEIDGAGNFRVQAGGGLVRDSVPENEAKESRAKAMGLLGMLTNAPQLQQTYMTPELRAKVADKLLSRNAMLSAFWMRKQNYYEGGKPSLDGLTVTILNNEDDFVFMIGHILRLLHADVKVEDSLSYDVGKESSNLVVIGPGPGDPTDMTHPRMKKLQEIIAALKAQNKPMLGICLGHQTLAYSMGLHVERQKHSTQGMQRSVSVRGQASKLGFYNSFSPVMDEAAKKVSGFDFDADEEGRIVAMQGARIAGFQFHPESIMSQNGMELLSRVVAHLRAAK